MAIKVVRTKSNGDVYKGVYRLPNKKQISRTFRKKKEAIQWCSEQRTLQSRGVFGDAAPITFETFANTWLEGKSSMIEPSTWNRYKSHMKNALDFFLDKRLNKITIGDVELWRRTLSQQYSAKSIRDTIGLFKKLMSDAVLYGHITENPTRFIVLPRTTDQPVNFWDQEDANKFLKFIYLNHSRFFWIYLFALNTGMRLGELQELRWDCIDVKRQAITVRRTYCTDAKKGKDTTKNKRMRIVPINLQLLDAVQQLKPAVTGSAYVLPRVDWRKMYRYTRKFARLAGVKEIRFHDLRHTFASVYMMNGGNLYDLQKILGHSTIQMTERYAHLSPDHLRGKTSIVAFGVGVTEPRV